ncbi:MAG: hypothetical protein K2X02_00175 [Alphaproteobacteria bacterium]|nr:hypothetical protein [Alphaproteobacteria bacterium]
MKKRIKVGLVSVLYLLPFPVEAEDEEPQVFTIPLEVREESPSVLDRHLKGEWGFSNDRGDTTTGGCSSCGS